MIGVSFNPNSFMISMIWLLVVSFVILIYSSTTTHTWALIRLDRPPLLSHSHISIPYTSHRQPSLRLPIRRTFPIRRVLQPSTVQSHKYTTNSNGSVASSVSISSSTLLLASPSSDDNSNEISLSNESPSEEPKLYSQRWIQLLYLSLLALLSDWICFSVAAVPDVFESVYGAQITAPSLIDLFLITNVISSFIVTDVVTNIGLQRAIQGSAVLMMIGCWLRSGLDFLPFVGSPDTNSLVSYPLVVVGTILVGISQPFFQCTPPLLSATWFAPSERATSTAIALNFNQIGIATAFLVGGAMAVDRTGLSNYMGLIALTCTIVTVGTLLQFQNEPLIAPSISEMNKKKRGIKEPPFRISVQRLFQKSGFTQALAAFICSISITNIIGAFIDEIMERGGIVEQFSIDLAGAGFEFAILLGGILIGGYVDRTKQYKNVTLACLAVTALMVIPLGLTEHQIGKEPILLILALLGLGLAAGPIQPINAELAVDVTYPSDETAVESVQQIGGNMISALLIPVADWASRRVDYEIFENVPQIASDIRGDVILLLIVALITMAYYSTFNAPLERSFADDDDEHTCSNVQVTANSTTDLINVESSVTTEALLQ